MDKADLEVIIERLKDKNPEIQKEALNKLHIEVKTYQGTVGIKNQEILDLISNMESALQFLSDHERRHLYDLLSVINVLENDILVLRYRIQGNVTELSEWGHHYVRKLASVISDIINCKLEEEENCFEIIISIINFLFQFNSEIEALDFAIEVTRLPLLFDCIGKKLSNNCEENSSYRLLSHETDKVWEKVISLVDEHNRRRVLVYLEEMESFYDLKDIMLKINSFDATRYLVCLLKYDEKEEAIHFVRSLDNPHVKKQCLYILARNSIYYKDDEETENILTNTHISEALFEVILSLELSPPKRLEYMFKGLNKEKIDAAAIANSLVHFAYCRDPVFFPQEGDFVIKQDYLEQLKLNKSISTLASVGLINAYDPSKVYDFYADEIFSCTDVGKVLALALSSYKTNDPTTSILTLLSPYLAHNNIPDGKKSAIAAMLGINSLFVGSKLSNVYDEIFVLFSSGDSAISLYSIFILGSVFPGDHKLLSSCIEVYNCLPKEISFSNFAILGLALFFYKKPKAHIPDENEDSKILHKEFLRLDKYSRILSLGFMYIGSGNPNIVDEIMSEAFSGDTDALLETLGMISCSLIGIADPLAVQLTERLTTSSLLLDSPHLRSVMPLCIALLYASNPKSQVIDILEKSINSGDTTVNSIIALGLVGAGTCSSRILRILDSNYAYLYKDNKASSALLFSQGLINLGKGLFTISPVCYDKQIILHKSIVGIVSTLFIFLDTNIFREYPFMLYSIVNAIMPKYVTGINGSAKVGSPIDIVGLAGNPNRISGAIVHTLPLILNENEIAELDEEVHTAYIEDILVKK